MQVNGYEIEKALNGTYWVRAPHGRHAWRFSGRTEALRFAQGLRRATAAPDRLPPTLLHGRSDGRQQRRA